MLLGNPDIEGAIGVGRGETIDPGPARHRGGDRADPRIALRQLGQRVAEDVLIGGRTFCGFRLLAGDDVEFGDPVILVGAVLRRGVALALLRHDMDQHRTLLAVADVLENGDQMIEIVAVDRADVIEAQFLEQRPAGDHAAGVFFRLLEAGMNPLAHLARDLGGQAAQAEIFAARDHSRQIGGQPADRGRDRHVVVVEDHHQPIARLLRVVHRLIGHARAHRAIADHRDAAAVLALHLVGHGEAQSGADRGRAMRRAEGVVFAFGTLGETRQPAALAQRADAVAATGQDLVRIALVPDIPDEPIGGRIEDVMDRHGELDHAEPGAEMSACRADRIDNLVAQFVGELAQLFLAQLAEIDRQVDGIKQRRLGFLTHRVRALHRLFEPVDERLNGSQAAQA